MSCDAEGDGIGLSFELKRGDACHGAELSQQAGDLIDGGRGDFGFEVRSARFVRGRWVLLERRVVGIHGELKEPINGGGFFVLLDQVQGPGHAIDPHEVVVIEGDAADMKVCQKILDDVEDPVEPRIGGLGGLHGCAGVFDDEVFGEGYLGEFDGRDALIVLGDLKVDPDGAVVFDLELGGIKDSGDLVTAGGHGEVHRELAGFKLLQVEPGDLKSPKAQRPVFVDYPGWVGRD